MAELKILKGRIPGKDSGARFVYEFVADDGRKISFHKDVTGQKPHAPKAENLVSDFLAQDGATEADLGAFVVALSKASVGGDNPADHLSALEISAKEALKLKKTTIAVKIRDVLSQHLPEVFDHDALATASAKHISALQSMKRGKGGLSKEDETKLFVLKGIHEGSIARRILHICGIDEK